MRIYVVTTPATICQTEIKPVFKCFEVDLILRMKAQCSVNARLHFNTTGLLYLRLTNIDKAINSWSVKHRQCAFGVRNEISTDKIPLVLDCLTSGDPPSCGAFGGNYYKAVECSFSRKARSGATALVMVCCGGAEV